MRRTARPLAFVPRVATLAALGPAFLFGCSAREHQETPARPTEAVIAPAPAQPAAAAASSVSASDRQPVAAAAKPVDDAPRVYAKTRFVWIMPQPGAPANAWSGFLWFGESVKLKRTQPVNGAGCLQWYEVQPHGFICVDGERATLDKNDPVLKAIEPYAARIDSPWPHEYGESRGVERYAAIPTHDVQKKREWDLADHLAKVDAARKGTVDKSLEGVDLAPAPAGPDIVLPKLVPGFYENREKLRPLSTVTWIAEEQKDDRTWLLGADLMWMPKDRVAPYKHVTFHGVKLGSDANLPLAFFRGKDRPKYRADGTDTGQKWTRLSYVELTGDNQIRDGKTYLETKDNGLYVAADDAVVPKPQEKTPWGAPVGGKDETGQTPAGRQTWIESSVWGGWLIAYEGTKPVYATMIAPGRGGTPVPGKEPISTASTPTGIFKITGKFITASMVAPYEFIHSDVPWTQNFSGPHALHGAYWHDSWGELMSGGCVNVSPVDGKWLFEFTEPKLPDGWHGMRWEPKYDPATTFVVHR